MKNTFLIYKPQKDGRAVLCTATAEEWLAAVNTNRNLPTEQRRYFISDCIEDGKEIDWMIIEVGYDEYRRWNSRHTIMERSRKAGKQYQHLSLDAVLSEADEITLLECLSGTENMEAAVIDDILMDELKKQLSNWSLGLRICWNSISPGGKDPAQQIWRKSTVFPSRSSANTSGSLKNL